MKKTDETYLEWLKKVDFRHIEHDPHTFIAEFDNKEIARNSDKNPVKAVSKLGYDVRAYYYIKYNNEEEILETPITKESIHKKNMKKLNKLKDIAPKNKDEIEIREE